jgi:hypothetical protein
VEAVKYLRGLKVPRYYWMKVGKKQWTRGYNITEVKPEDKRPTIVF